LRLPPWASSFTPRVRSARRRTFGMRFRTISISIPSDFGTGPTRNSCGPRPHHRSS